MGTTCGLIWLLAIGAGAATPSWQVLAPGLDLGSFTASTPAPVGDGTITILRIDPELWDLELLGSSSTGEPAGHTAREWCAGQGLTAAINAGMFATDHRTHLGVMRSGDHVNNGKANRYQSAAAFDPLPGKEIARFRIFDLDDAEVTMPALLHDYCSVVQNLRLIRRPGVNRWGQQKNRWSEAALGEDAQGRALFIFSRSPFTMHDLNGDLMSLGIGLVAAQHLEGGPEAQLYLRIGDVEFEGFGSYETGFREDDSNDCAWPIPNVLGIRPRKADAR